MAYIGNKPAEKYATFSKQSITPDGSTTTFTLDHSVANENELEVFVDNVRQEPGSGKAYTASGTTLTMSEAVGSASSFYVLFQGKATQTVTPGDGTVTNTHLAGSITNAKLANSNITINGTSIALGASGTIVAGTDWQSVITADGSTFNTAVAGEGYFIDTSSAAHTITLPASPTQGDEVTIVDYAGTFGTNAVTVGRNGSNIDGVASDGTLSTNRLNVRFVYIDATQGWKAIFDDASEAYGETFVSATGGTVTTSGDYKIHTFTGDGCFVVSDIGTGPTAGKISYMVVAGGGAARDGGAGGGGFREGKITSDPYSASPLDAGAGLTVTATTYPITVGAGGADSPTDSARNGSNSVFSTITSNGGGYGTTASPGNPGGPGGSGGAGRGGSGGTGNTPPVSPPQGNPGGNSSGPDSGAGGGGGATASGGAWPGPRVGGTGATTSISGSAVGYSGGGGGASPGAGPNIPREPSGSGGAAISGSQSAPGTQCGVVNRGGGGGGVWCGTNGAGGSGVVILRYKYQ